MRRPFPTHIEADLVNALREGAHLTISLVALVDERLVGHVAFGPVTTAGPGVGLGLAPVAVLPGCRNRGIAAALIRAGLEASRDRAVDFVVVLGEPRYYSRFGFVPARSGVCGTSTAAGTRFKSSSCGAGRFHEATTLFDTALNSRGLSLARRPADRI